MKNCTICGIEKEFIEFSIRNDSRDGYRNNCKSCQNNIDKLRYENNREAIIKKNTQYRKLSTKNYSQYYYKYNQFKKYGLDATIRNTLLEQQNNKCGLCKNDFGSQICTDHDHSLSKEDGIFVRGFLCRGCNTGLGNFKDSIITLLRAIIYLIKSRIKLFFIRIKRRITWNIILFI